MRIVVSGGGTAGHISPILATIEELKKLDSNLTVLFIGSGKEIERKMVSKSGIDYQSISTGKFRRYGRGWLKSSLDLRTNWQNLVDFFQVNAGIMQARRIIKKFKPDIVFIKGGYVGLPTGLAAHWLKIPFINHESDIVPGIANRYLSRWAVKTAVGFPVKYYYGVIERSKLVFVGNPLRRCAISGDITTARQFFGLSKTRPVLLVLGGSQGSRSINQLIFDGLEQILTKYQLIHLTGDRDRLESLAQKRNLDKKRSRYYHPFAFLINKIGLAYCASEIVIARAGANTISEIASWAKPSIIIPMSKSANNHQNINAQVLQTAKAAIVLKQDQLTAGDLLQQVDNLNRSDFQKQRLVQNIKQFEKKKAAFHLAKLLYQTAKLK